MKRIGRLVMGERVMAAWAVFALMLVVLAGVVMAQPASAATIDGIKDVRVEQSSSVSGSEIKVDVDWSVADSAQPGDTFTLRLPAQLNPLTAGFDLRDAGGSIVAKATVVNGLVTFTLTDYVATHRAVSGTAYFWGEFRTTAETGTPVELTFEAGATVFTDEVTVGPVEQISRTQAAKGGWWIDPVDQGITDGKDALSWEVASPQGPSDTLTFVDTVGAGQRMECATLAVWTTNEVDPQTGNLIDLQPVDSSRYAVTCDASGATVVVHGGLADGEIIQIDYQTSVTEIGLEAYDNTAKVTTGSGTEDATDTVKRYGAGGDGSGLALADLSVTKVVAGDGEPTGPWTVAVDCTLDGDQITGFPQELTFTEAGTQTVRSVVGAVCSATEPEAGGADEVEVSDPVTVAADGSSELVVTNTFTAPAVEVVTTPTPTPTPTPVPTVEPAPTPAPQPASSGVLPQTGAAVTVAGVLAALAACGLGALLLVVARRNPSGRQG